MYYLSELKKSSPYIKKIIPWITLLSMLFSTGLPGVHAASKIIFQDDSFADVYSDALQLGSNDSGAVNTSIRFGANIIVGNNGNIIWDITNQKFLIDKSVAITGGISATGNANFSGSSEFHVREVVTASAASCTTVKEIVLETSTNRFFVCTAIGAPGTWTTSSGGETDFEGVYALDTGQNLVTSNNPFTITTGTSNTIIDSNSWNVTASGALDAATITSNGLLTGTGGANINGGILNFNVSSSFVTNIGTGSSTGQVNIGGGSNCVKVDSNTWDMSCAGVASGLTGLTSTGPINFSGGSGFQIPQFASDPLTCTPGEQYYNTATATVRLCTATNTWGSTGAAGSQYAFVYDTTTQTVSTAGTFQDITFTTNAQINGWSHTAGSASFTSTTAGIYMVNVVGRVAKSGGANTTISFRGVKNGTEVAGSQSYGTAAGSTGDTLSGNFILPMSAGDILKIQMTGGTNQVQILPGGNGTTRPSIQLSIWRLS